MAQEPVPVPWAGQGESRREVGTELSVWKSGHPGKRAQAPSCPAQTHHTALGVTRRTALRLDQAGPPWRDRTAVAPEATTRLTHLALRVTLMRARADSPRRRGSTQEACCEARRYGGRGRYGGHGGPALLGERNKLVSRIPAGCVCQGGCDGTPRQQEVRHDSPTPLRVLTLAQDCPHPRGRRLLPPAHRRCPAQRDHHGL